MKFTEKLKSLRNNAGLTQEAAAEQIGVSVTSLQNWESGVNKPRQQAQYVQCEKNRGSV